MVYNQIFYQGITYEVLNTIRIDKNIFYICIDCINNKARYLIEKKLSSKIAYFEYDNLIKVLPQYNNVYDINQKFILDYFVKKLNQFIEIDNNINYKKLANTSRKAEEYIANYKSYFSEDAKQQISPDFISQFNEYITNINNSFVTLTIDDLLKPDQVYMKEIYLPFYKKKECNIALTLSMVSLTGFVICCHSLVNWVNDNNNTSAITRELMEEVNEKYERITNEPVTENSGEVINTYESVNNTSVNKIDLNVLKQTNPDTVAWIKVNNTNINYPVVQTDNNTYYLSHSFDGSKNSAGWIFADFRSNLNEFEKNTVLYGHGRVDNSIFGSLRNILDEKWYTNEDNHIIELRTAKKTTKWKIFSVYSIPAESYYLTHTFENDKSYNKFLTTLVSRSIYDFGTNLSTDDNIITLSTCLDNNGNRVVLHAKLIN